MNDKVGGSFCAICGHFETSQVPLIDPDVREDPRLPPRMPARGALALGHSQEQPRARCHCTGYYNGNICPHVSLNAYNDAQTDAERGAAGVLLRGDIDNFVAAHRAEANVEKRMAIEAILLILRTAEAVEWVDGIRQPQLRI
jgi:hypothetical protein